MAGLDALLDTIPAKGEVFLLANDFEPPRTDQFNLGIRQKFGDFQTALTFAYGNTSNLFAWYIAPPGPQEALAPGAVLMHGWGAHAGLMLPAAPWPG